MVENKNSFQYYAMLFGTYMGIFWILKFALFPLGLRYYPVLLLFFVLLTAAVPFLGYYYVWLFREKVCKGSIRFLNAWIFVLLMYVFASLLTAVGHYIYFQYFDNGFIFNTYSTIINTTTKSNPVLPKEYLKEANLMLEALRVLSPIKITLQLISQNVFYGNILALITALFVMKRPK